MEAFMATAADLSVRCGEDWAALMTFKRDGVETLVDAPVAEVREEKTHTSVLILRMDSVDEPPAITQASPGQLAFFLPADVTAALTPGTYYWDLFGTVNGARIKLADIGKFVVHASVSA